MQLAFAGGVATKNDIRDVRDDVKELDRKMVGVSDSLDCKIDSECAKLDHKIDLMVNKLTRRMIAAMGVVAILTGLATSFL